MPACHHARYSKALAYSSSTGMNNIAGVRHACVMLARAPREVLLFRPAAAARLCVPLVAIYHMSAYNGWNRHHWNRGICARDAARAAMPPRAHGARAERKRARARRYQTS